MRSSIVARTYRGNKTILSNTTGARSDAGCEPCVKASIIKNALMSNNPMEVVVNIAARVVLLRRGDNGISSNEAYTEFSLLIPL